MHTKYIYQLCQQLDIPQEESESHAYDEDVHHEHAEEDLDGNELFAALVSGIAIECDGSDADNNDHKPFPLRD